MFWSFFKKNPHFFRYMRYWGGKKCVVDADTLQIHQTYTTDTPNIHHRYTTDTPNIHQTYTRHTPEIH